MGLVITQSKTFRAVAESIVPEIRQLGAMEWQEVAGIVEHAVGQRPTVMRQQLSLFLRALNVLSLLKHGRTVAHLIPSMRAEFLHGIENSSVLAIRRGFWGVRTLILMGYYARASAMPLIGYRAHVHGWLERQTL